MDIILFLKALLLGIIEGATEFIPVSSTGHLILAQNWLSFMGHKENAFIVFIQLGAILAVVWLYRIKFINIAFNLHRDAQARRLIINMIIATIPAVIVGLPTEEWIEAYLFKPLPVALALVFGGLAIILIEKRNHKIEVESVDDIPILKALWVGVFQVLAIIFPGVSRSGATIMGGLVLGLSRKASTEFSFFLAIPAMFGATLIKVIGIRDILSVNDVPLFSVGFVVSFIAALIVIKGLLSFVSRRSFMPFAWYRIIFGAALLIGFWYFNVGF